MSNFDPGTRCGAGSAVILCADDYAMTEGVSAAIEELGAARRLSATSALVTTRHWPRHASRIARLRERMAVGLHLNLTLGAPLGHMPRLAPCGELPPLRRLIGGSLDEIEIAEEVTRQIDRFEADTGHPPDVIDGHQHVHVLPGVRRAVLRAISDRYPGPKPLLRNPTDSPAAIMARGAAVSKALTIAALAAGFGARARAHAFLTNRGFSGVSRFDERVPYRRELERFFLRPGPLHLVMCHPGHPDAELERLDPVVVRRRAELTAMMEMADLSERIWHPVRLGAAGRIAWPGTAAAHG